MENIILSSIDKETFISEILVGVKEIIDSNNKALLNEKINLTAQEVAEFCKVSKVTIHDWTKKGILIKYKIGNRIFYKRNEVLKAINKIEQV